MATPVKEKVPRNPAFAGDLKDSALGQTIEKAPKDQPVPRRQISRNKSYLSFLVRHPLGVPG